MSEGQYSEITGSLSAHLDALSAGDAARLGVALCGALSAARPERGFHGALYPNNILLAADGQVRLGPPLTLGAEFSPDELEYLAPELFWNGSGSPASDVYAIGLILYAACSGGRGVFLGDAGEITAEKRAGAVQRRLKGEIPREPRDAGDELAQVILRAIAFREEERWPDTEDLRAALEDCSVFSAPPLEKRTGADVLGAAVGLAADAAALAKRTAQPAKAEKPAAAGKTAAAPMAPAPRAVAPGAKNEDVVIPVPQPAKPAKKAEAKPPKPKTEPKPVKTQAAPAKTEPKSGKTDAAPAKAETRPDKAAPEPAKAESKPVRAEPQKAAAAPKPAKKSKSTPEPVPDNRPRPVFDAAHAGRKKRSPFPIIATVVALLVIFLVVLYLLKGGDAAPETSPSPDVSAPVNALVTPSAEPEPTASAEPSAAPTPDATPTATPTPDATPTPEPDFSVALAETGSADWTAAQALCSSQGGHLPIVRNQDDLSALIAAAEAEGLRYVWLDASRGADGTWRWSDGTEADFFDWYNGEPSGTDTDGPAENYLMLWKYGGVWGYNDMRSDPAAFAPGYYSGKIGVFCQK